MDKIESLADLRPGDLLFGPIGGPVGVGVALGQLALGEGVRLGRLSVRHVGIVVAGGHQEGGPLLAQAMPGGAEVVRMTGRTHWTSRHAYARLPEDYPGQGEDAAAVARLMVTEGVSYSFASYAALAAWRWGWKTPRLEQWMGRVQPQLALLWPSGGGKLYTGADPSDSFDWVRLPVEAICSVFADQAWTLAGKRVMEGVPRQVVTPGAMALQLFHRPGVLWGGAGWLL